MLANSNNRGWSQKVNFLWKIMLIPNNFLSAVDDEILGEAVPSFKAKKEHNDRKYTCRDKNHQYYMGGANEVTQQEQQLAVYCK